MFALWFCCFLDFSVVQSVAALNVFVGAEACCLVIGHNGQKDSAKLIGYNWISCIHDQLAYKSIGEDTQVIRQKDVDRRT
jgi:hypothetical protein